MTRGPAPIPPIACRSGSSTSSPGTTCSRGTCSCRRTIRCRRAEHVPQFTVIDAPNFKADPARHGSRSDCFIFVHFGKAARADRRHQLRRRDQEVDLHDPQLPAAAARACSRCTARRTSARTATRRCSSACPAPERRRLSSDPVRRLLGDDEHGWSDRGRLQLRRRLLREGHQAVRGGRAADLRDDAPVRNAARERRHGPRDARSRSGRRVAHRKHARLVSAALHRQRNPHGTGRASAQHRHADGRRLRRAAADCAADARTGDVSLPFRLHGASGRHREGRDGAEGGIQHLLRRAVPSAAPERLRPDCSARKSRSTTPESGWSTRDGPADRTASAAG